MTYPQLPSKVFERLIPDDVPKPIPERHYALDITTGDRLVFGAGVAPIPQGCEISGCPDSGWSSSFVNAPSKDTGERVLFHVFLCSMHEHEASIALRDTKPDGWVEAGKSWLAMKNAPALPALGSSWSHSGCAPTRVTLIQDGVIYFADSCSYKTSRWPGEWKPVEIKTAPAPEGFFCVVCYKAGATRRPAACIEPGNQYSGWCEEHRPDRVTVPAGTAIHSRNNGYPITNLALPSSDRSDTVKIASLDALGAEACAKGLHAFATQDGAMHVCKRCGLGRRTISLAEHEREMRDIDAPKTYPVRDLIAKIDGAVAEWRAQGLIVDAPARWRPLPALRSRWRSICDTRDGIVEDVEHMANRALICGRWYTPAEFHRDWMPKVEPAKCSICFVETCPGAKGRCCEAAPEERYAAMAIRIERAVDACPAELNRGAYRAALVNAAAIGALDAAVASLSDPGIRGNARYTVLSAIWADYDRCAAALSAPRLGRPTKPWWDRAEDRKVTLRFGVDRGHGR